MALKGLRNVVPEATDISYTLSDAADAGVIVTWKTAGSGQALGAMGGEVQLSASSSGTKPAGILLNEFVDIDETVRFRNRYKDQMVIGEPATVVRKGVFTTNMVVGSPTLGDTAYLTSSGNIMPTNNGAAATPPVGQFLGKKDEDGYVKVWIELP